MSGIGFGYECRMEVFQNRFVGRGNLCCYPFAVAEPHLWNGVKDPYLYTLDIYLLSGEEVLETVTTEIGFRQ